MPESPRPPPHLAVFLSYAHEDADAARRIADALRSHGIAVWFDRSELRGGDAWDQKIRRQIKECALFLPIVSARTQDRGEGYFRLEWKLAVERTHLMAEGVPFLVPVTIDDTPETSAVVPEPFLHVQWTPLPGGLPTPSFIEQVKRLLAAPRKPVAEGSVHFATARVSTNARPGRPPARVGPVGIAGLAAALILAVALGWSVLQPQSGLRPPGQATSQTDAQSPPANAAPVANEKSLAVLPFENLSPDKENEFFTSGIHEEILAALQTVRELQVIQYRGARKPIRQVGEDLKVAYALECSVRRAGSRVRVTGKLINTRTEAQAWAENFEGDLTDVFAIQSELAKAIAAKLSATIAPAERSAIERRPTSNVAAYDLYLKARDIRIRSPNTRNATDRTEALLMSAVELDPNFAPAWGELAFTHAFRYSDNQDRTEMRLAQARHALDTMKRLAPGDPETLRAEGNFLYFTLRDYPRALERFTQALALRPNDPETYMALCQVQRRQGRWEECMANFRRAIALDPQNDRLLRNAAATLDHCRRYDESLALERRRAELDPNSIEPRLKIAVGHFRATGATAAGDAATRHLPPGPQADWAYEKGDFKTVLHLDEQGALRGNLAIKSLVGLGDEAAARNRVAAIVERLKATAEAQPSNASRWITLAESLSVLGRHEEALDCGRRAVELVPESSDSWSGPGYASTVAALRARAGETDAAVREYARLLRNGGANVHQLRVAPLPATLRQDPRFQALLNEPKNNAPLF